MDAFPAIRPFNPHSSRAISPEGVDILPKEQDQKLGNRLSPPRVSCRSSRPELPPKTTARIWLSSTTPPEATKCRTALHHFFSAVAPRTDRGAQFPSRRAVLRQESDKAVSSKQPIVSGQSTASRIGSRASTFLSLAAAGWRGGRLCWCAYDAAGLLCCIPSPQSVATAAEVKRFARGHVALATEDAMNR